MSRAQTVLMTFDAQSLATLDRMVQHGGYEDRGDCVQESLKINHLFQQLAAQGFTEVLVRNPNDDRYERELVIPRLKHIARRARRSRRTRRNRR
ncbi:hypothetical protein [Deinococcus radiotolerans]|uniref:CopG family transcriptional regulator n=1 Tax=Deinococcus radiotolerans TaxID=1309407 RepID=A0ABQ2FQ32_9DEIO|nr:hypothetical protein [Deinococcus radiotolerans]GGL15680.1 hypothetical protein GCM10010844_38270 [Deinococcus radiotolerans]